MGIAPTNLHLIPLVYASTTAMLRQYSWPQFPKNSVYILHFCHDLGRLRLWQVLSLNESINVITILNTHRTHTQSV